MALSHAVTQHVQAPPDAAFAYLADPIALGRWSLGCFDTEAVGKGLFTGLSLFDDARGYFRIDADREHGRIDYLVGSAERLTHRISALVMPGDSLGYGARASLVTLIAWRPADMSDERWARLCASHDAEIWLIRSQIETRFASQGG